MAGAAGAARCQRMRLQPDQAKDCKQSECVVSCRVSVTSWRQDMAPHCQHVLLRHTAGCVFQDLCERFPGVAELQGVQQAYGWMALWSGVQAVPMVPEGFCVRHGGACHFPTAEVEVAGPTCTDFSPEGLRQGLSGPTLLPFLCWSRSILQSSTLRLVVFENVKEFPLELLEMMFSEHFHLYPFLLSPADFGFSLVRRQRRYVLMVSRRRAHLRHCPYRLMASIVEGMATVRTAPRHAWLASTAEVLDEVWQLAWRRWSRRSRRSPPASIVPCSPWDVLSSRERAVVECCRDQLWSSSVSPGELQDVVMFLGDNAWSRRCWFTQIPTLRTNTGLLWCPRIGRWLTWRERLAVMGFPTYPQLAAALGIPVWNPPPGVPAAQMAGNAMHVACVACVLLTGLASVRQT